jgi:hypothetical protein
MLMLVVSLFYFPSETNGLSYSQEEPAESDTLQHPSAEQASSDQSKEDHDVKESEHELEKKCRESIRERTEGKTRERVREVRENGGNGL